MKLQAACELPQTRRKYTPKFVPLILALTFVFTLLPLYFPFSHNKSNSLTSLTIGSYQHRTPPKPNTPPPRHEKVRHGYGGGGVAQELSTSPPPNLDTPANKTQVRKPEEEEIQSPGSAQTDLIVARGVNSKSEEISSKRQPARDRDMEVDMIRSNTSEGSKKCDLFTGEWVPNAEGPYYTNTTCNAIQEHQNCMKFGRPDTGFLKWRWKPDECEELPIFDPNKFLELVRGKSMAFVGDSVARNHMQSLICLLSRVVHPVDVSKPTDENRLYQYTDYNFNLSIISSPYLIRTQKTDPNDFTRPFNLFLDEFDQTWTSKIHSFDYIIISAGHWFFRPTYFYLNRTLAGCLYCPEPNVTHLASSFSARWAFQTAFRAINAARNFNGVTFLRTFAPSHFEGGPWDKGGDCVRTRPFKRNETVLEDYSLEMYSIQLEELRTAQEAGMRTGRKFRLFDATKPMLLRADGHPSKYGHWPVANQTIPNDCVHWCLPGPIDAWNDFLQELLKREVGVKAEI
ncbi:UNVERIFIED_CONTAM: protein trichome birefringence-like 19 [Sesamum radiatum]|uniref:Protein trichome birefringence-like 19 n=1 Tax=Sesamum radiatum TaxID=300843 RepID=A0AAW2P3H4_SESRA